MRPHIMGGKGVTNPTFTNPTFTNPTFTQKAFLQSPRPSLSGPLFRFRESQRSDDMFPPQTGLSLFVHTPTNILGSSGSPNPPMMEPCTPTIQVPNHGFG